MQMIWLAPDNSNVYKICAAILALMTCYSFNTDLGIFVMHQSISLTQGIQGIWQIMHGVKFPTTGVKSAVKSPLPIQYRGFDNTSGVGWLVIW